MLLLQEEAVNSAYSIPSSFLNSKHLRGADEVKLLHALRYPCTPFQATELTVHEYLPCSALMDGQGCGFEFFLKE
jgi:hypothetical protein